MKSVYVIGLYYSLFGIKMNLLFIYIYRDAQKNFYCLSGKIICRLFLMILYYFKNIEIAVLHDYTKSYPGIP